MIRAREVLPVPGGPKRTMEERRSASIARRNSLPWERICSWPVYSSREIGRMRSPRGACGFHEESLEKGSSGVGGANKSDMRFRADNMRDLFNFELRESARSREIEFLSGNL